jgi:hypothetical protein
MPEESFIRGVESYLYCQSLRVFLCAEAMKTLKLGEKIYRIIATYSDVKCEECGCWVPKGHAFLLDKVPYDNWSGGFLQRKIHNHKICEGCWKGPKNVIVDLTKSVDTKRAYRHGRHPFTRARKTWVQRVCPWRDY